MPGPASITRRTFWLYAKLAAVLVPSFLLVSAAGLSWISADRMQAAREQMALRIGNAQARVGAALERYSDRAVGPVDWSKPIVMELLNSLLSNPSVSCVELRAADVQTGTLATVPQGLGCTDQPIDDVSVIDLYTEPPTLLRVMYHEQELIEARASQREFSTLILVGGMVVALLTSWLAFRYVVGRPLQKLLRGIEVARDQAEKANRVKSDFMAKMSHELRTPLNAIVGTVEVLADNDGKDADRRDQLATITRASNDLLALVTDILDVAALEEGTLELDRGAYDPVTLLRDIAASVEPGFAAKGIRFDIEITLPPGDLIEGDAIRMRQVLLNLLDNALKFTARGQVGVWLEQPTPGSLRFTVRDTGPGIAMEQRKSLFEAFEQGRNDRSRAFDGAGLGLTICHKVVQAMGGRLDIGSTAKTGTTVQVTIPVTRVPGPVVAPAVSVAPSGTAATPRPLDILVAEDNATNRKVLGAFLKKLPHRVHYAENGALAVEAARKIEPDLVFMDISMPVMDGHEAAATIRREEKAQARPRARIVALTANTGADDRKMARNAGMDDFLAKPVRRAVVETAISALQTCPDAKDQNITPTSQSVSPGKAASKTTRTRSESTKGATPA